MYVFFQTQSVAVMIFFVSLVFFQNILFYYGISTSLLSLSTLSAAALQYADSTGVRPYLQVSCVYTLNCIWWWGSSAAALGNMEYSFMVITPRPALSLRNSDRKGPIYESNGIVQSFTKDYDY